MKIEETRKRLSLSKENYTDDEVEDIIAFVESLADIFIDEYLKIKDANPKNIDKVSKLFTKLESNNLAKTK